MSLLCWFRRFWDRHGPARRLLVIESDTLPTKMPRKNLVLTRDDGEKWSVGMLCPCGCGAIIELLVLPEAKPRWNVEVDGNNHPTLNPSVWRQTGCRSHFWVRRGHVHWCD